MIQTGVALSTLAYSGVAGFGVGTAFLFVRWIASFIAGRIDRKEDRLDAGMGALIDGLREQIALLREDCTDLRSRVSNAEAELLECKKQHADSNARVKELEATLLGAGHARQHAALIVAAEKVKKG